MTASALAAALRRHLEDRLDRPETVARLHPIVTRHLPVEGAEAGSTWCPPMYALRLATALGLPEHVALAFAVAGACYFSAADVADDVADGDLRRTVGLDLNDACRLLFLVDAALADLPDVDADTRLALMRLFAARGLQMADGQEDDLEGTDAIEAADPLDISLRKTGAEYAVFFAGPALLAGLDPAPWADFGQALGALLQTLTDYFDQFLQPESDDWLAGKPTLPLRHGLAQPTHGPALRTLLAGDRHAADRAARAAWHLVQAGAGDRMAAAMATLRGRLDDAAARAGEPPILAELAAELLDMGDGVVEALAEYRGDPAPPVRPLADEVAEAVDATRRFLAADASFDGATEVHRWGLFGAPDVRAGLFGRLVICDALWGLGLPLDDALACIFAQADGDGWRYYPGHADIPTDADDTGMALQLAARCGRAGDPAVRRGAEALLANRTDDGRFHTWLCDGRTHQRAVVDATWAGGLCPGVNANALLGLWAVDAAAHREVVRAGARALADWTGTGPEAPPSAFYKPVTVDALIVRCLTTVLGDEPAEVARLRPAVDAALARLTARARLDGRFGGVIDTALAGWTLAGAGQLRAPEATLRALVDALEPDGGHPAEDYFVTVGVAMQHGWYGARALTSALVLRAIARLAEAP
ncbi:MAG: polyprenyl synthetase family protein [Myxococcales bacterium]|nr:polyprenyl synthetase family protein [Myxococcales bacterium]